jgi:Fe-S-cluster containining protein
VVDANDNDNDDFGDDGEAMLDALEARAKKFEADVVIPHCAVCKRPCCALTDLVLDLSFVEASGLYRIGAKKKAFDADLPPAIKKQQAHYFAHGTPCPAYDVAGHRCEVYDTERKPRGCSEFPIYADGDGVTADLRCEAVAAALTTLQPMLQAAVGPGGIVHEDIDEAFPDFFVHFSIEPSGV